jgi:S-DNA-T family DNA segregation ATPase FtsK/SpoIIIE
MAGAKGSRLSREIWGIVLFVLAVLLVLSLFSYDPRDRSLNAPSGRANTFNWGGVVGAYVSDLLLQGIGLSAFLLPFFVVFVSYRLFREPEKEPVALKLTGCGFLLWSATIFLSLVRETEVGRGSGGVLGGFSRDVLVAMFGGVGAYVIAGSLLVLGLMLVSQRSLLVFWEATRKRAVLLQKWAKSHALDLQKRLEKRLKEKRAENPKKEQRELTPPPIVLHAEVKEEPARKPKKKPVALQEELPLAPDGDAFMLPSPSLLDSPEGSEIKIDRETLEANSLVLQKKLADFGVEGEVVAVRPGPVITMYEFKPAAGVKVRRIVTLADDLAMALRAVSVRILAPIPGESVVGIEIPNPRREKVFFRQMIESEVFQKSESKVTLALGKQISGAPFVADLGRMPHLLVAGATGTGKSVSMNAMVLSILLKSTPHDVRFIMIDPKMLELTVYEDLPYLLVPVVTDPKRAAAALYWAMDEMDRRYRMMREKGARNIDQYNRILDRDASDPDRIIDLKEVESAGLMGPGSEEGGMANGAPLVHEHLPRIVIVVDELADLMMSVGRDIEEHITRLAQKARAAGIHLILATQRPSVDVITGLIKANFPARVSFQVTSRVDSRTILDSIGAERLLGDGDMLFLPPGSARLMRIHGAYVSDPEIKRVVNFIKQQGKPQYKEEIFAVRSEVEKGYGEDEYDEMYDRAVELVCESQQASISMVQRRLRVGYNRAARMIEQMERDGIVGPAEGAKPREVYGRKMAE